MILPIQIWEFVVRLPDSLFPYQGKTRIQVRKATAVASPEPGWMPVTTLVGQFFQPAFGMRNPLNIPGPFYGAETDTCETGTVEAPNNVLLDRSGQEFVFTQPRDEDELRDIISAAIRECFVGYGADGDDHWTLALIREWWRSRHDLLSLSSQAIGIPESKVRWQRILYGEGEAYLRAYAFFVENRRLPTDNDTMPELE
jgi:hypothetical protein